MPGTAVYSAGFFGCNLSCPFCQNWEISQRFEGGETLVEAEDLVRRALRSGAPSLAFTYSEPLVHFEYLLEAAGLAKASGLATVLVTNGCLREEPARELISVMDAVNVDLKCFSGDRYARELGGNLAAVLGFIELANAASRLEVTTLIVPGLSDDEETIDGIVRFLASVDKDIPLHLSAYHPAYRYKIPAPPAARVKELAARAKSQLSYVYVGNIAEIEANSYCPSCGLTLVERHGYRVEVSGLSSTPPSAKGTLAGQSRFNASCSRCHSPLPFLL